MHGVLSAPVTVPTARVPRCFSARQAELAFGDHNLGVRRRERQVAGAIQGNSVTGLPFRPCVPADLPRNLFGTVRVVDSNVCRHFDTVSTDEVNRVFRSTRGVASLGRGAWRDRAVDLPAAALAVHLLGVCITGLALEAAGELVARAVRPVTVGAEEAIATSAFALRHGGVSATDRARLITSESLLCCYRGDCHGASYADCVGGIRRIISLIPFESVHPADQSRGERSCF